MTKIGSTIGIASYGEAGSARCTCRSFRIYFCLALKYKIPVRSPLHNPTRSSQLIPVGFTAFKRSEFAIINTDNPDDLPIEDQMPVEDTEGLSLSLRLHYERYTTSGGAFKVQVYAPYVVYNKTGLDVALQSKSPFSKPKNVAGRGTYSSKIPMLPNDLLQADSLPQVPA